MPVRKIEFAFANGPNQSLLFGNRDHSVLKILFEYSFKWTLRNCSLCFYFQVTLLLSLPCSEKLRGHISNPCPFHSVLMRWWFKWFFWAMLTEPRQRRKQCPLVYSISQIKTSKHKPRHTSCQSHLKNSFRNRATLARGVYSIGGNQLLMHRFTEAKVFSVSR